MPAHKQFLTLLFLLIFQHAFSQKRFDITISLDSSINSNKIFCSYDNGKDTVYVKNEFVNNRCRLSGNFYSNSVSFTVYYTNPQNAYCSNTFHIDTRPAKVRLTDTTKATDGSRLKYDSAINVHPVTDTTFTHLNTQLYLFRKKEAVAMSQLWEKHAKHIIKEDSFEILNQKYFRALNDKTFLFLKKHPKDYFSLWCFQQQVVGPSLSVFRGDTSYFRSLVLYFTSTFPVFYTASFEGQKIVDELGGLIKSKRPSQVALPFSLKNIAGKTVSLSDFKGKYILLDFWASWCRPCRQNNPVLKMINQKYKSSNFELISISADTNPISWESASKQDSLDWVNLSDLKGIESGVATEYGISSYPTYILIDPSGKIILRTENEIEKIDGELQGIFKSGS